ncbi:glycosyltransferase family 2 protein [Roseococcus sp. DSY-14]|uniref:glycosyltransferase family 2 protein n=1 Tax=Roseococcus sp. DSY-14 TaxID=3369650 RepID=UPI00387B517A
MDIRPAENPPLVDVNLLFHGAEATLDEAIAAVARQTWTHWRLTLLDDGSTDGGPAIAAAWAARDPRIRVKRHRANQGIVGAYRRAFVEGDADFVMPKSADDVIEPRFMEALMDRLLAEPAAAMCHAAAVTTDMDGAVLRTVPAATRLDTPEGGPLARARHVMARYTEAPAFWGIYRRAAVDAALAPRECGGWDHAFLADIALHGHIRHVPEVLFRRRGGQAGLSVLARNAALPWSRRRAASEALADFSGICPVATCVWAHVETFALARLPEGDCAALIESARDVLGRRWDDLLAADAARLAAFVADAIPWAMEHAEAGMRGVATKLLLHLLELTERCAFAAPPGPALRAAQAAVAAALPQARPPARRLAA